MNLLKSTGTFGFYTIICRLLGYLRDILIAIFLGTGMLADAFFVAFRIPNTFRRLFAEGTFNAAFVPSYSSEITKGKKQSNKFANDIFNLLFLGLLFLTIIIEIFMPAFVSIIAPGFVGDLEKMEIAINLTRITFPFLLFIFSIIAFVLIQAPPGDFLTSYIAELAASGSSMERAQIDALRALYGLDQPLHIQYFKWISRLVVGDLGISLDWQKPISELIGERMGLTLALGLGTFLFTWAVAIPIGVLSATRKYSFFDYFFL